MIDTIKNSFYLMGFKFSLYSRTEYKEIAECDSRKKNHQTITKSKEKEIKRESNSGKMLKIKI